MAKEHRFLPLLVLSLSIDFGATVVGSAAGYLHELDLSQPQPRDWDLIVPPANWAKVMRLLRSQPNPIQFNSFGGVKMLIPHQDKEVELDCWPSSLEDHLANATAGDIYYQAFKNRFLLIE